MRRPSGRPMRLMYAAANTEEPHHDVREDQGSSDCSAVLRGDGICGRPDTVGRSPPGLPRQLVPWEHDADDVYDVDHDDADDHHHPGEHDDDADDDHDADDDADHHGDADDDHDADDDDHDHRDHDDADDHHDADHDDDHDGRRPRAQPDLLGRVHGRQRHVRQLVR